MNENTVIKVSNTIANSIDLKKCKNESLLDIEFSINKINTILKNEKTRKELVNNELKKQKQLTENDLQNHLNIIENNIKKLTLYVQILENKKRALFFDAKSYFKNLKEINICDATTL